MADKLKRNITFEFETENDIFIVSLQKNGNFKIKNGNNKIEANIKDIFYNKQNDSISLNDFRSQYLINKDFSYETKTRLEQITNQLLKNKK
jgi:hypothetical protein